MLYEGVKERGIEMQRIAFIVFRMFFEVIYYFQKFCHYAKEKNRDYDATRDLLQKACKRVIHCGRVNIIIEGTENIPEKDGFMFYPNHQGMFDVLIFFASCPKALAFVIKKEVENVIVLKQIIKATGSIPMDRKDLRQSIRVINEVSEEVKKGRNFIIFAEGTRSRQGNKLLEFKGGSFKAAMNAKCPIVPCALIDSYRPFDEKGIKRVTVTLKYLEPIMYEEYKDMKGQEIANLVKSRIEEAIEKNN